VDRPCAGFLHGWYSGQEAGGALPTVLFARLNPWGTTAHQFRSEPGPTIRCTTVIMPTPPANTVIYKEGVFMGYRGYEHNGGSAVPLWLRPEYTTFAFKNLGITPTVRNAAKT